MAGLLAMAAGVSLVVGAIPPHRDLVEGTPVARTILNDSGTPIIGPLDADITIVAFSDYLCTPCRLGEAAFEKVVASDGRIRVLYKDWAALGMTSRSAARIALAADRQGRYLAVHQALMRARVRLTPDNIRLVAISAGADWTRLQADLKRDGPAIDAQLAKHAFQAWSLGLQGPPGYLIGPYLVRGGLSENNLTAALAAARRHFR